MDIGEFVGARLNEELALAKLSLDGGVFGGEWLADGLIVRDSLTGEALFTVDSSEHAQHIACHNPSRVVAEASVKLAIVTQWMWVRHGRDPQAAAAVQKVLVGLAAAWATHPDYKLAIS